MRIRNAKTMMDRLFNDPVTMSHLIANKNMLVFAGGGTDCKILGKDPFTIVQIGDERYWTFPVLYGPKHSIEPLRDMLERIERLSDYEDLFSKDDDNPAQIHVRG